MAKDQCRKQQKYSDALMLAIWLHPHHSTFQDAAKPGRTKRVSMCLKKHPYEIMEILGLLKDSCPGHTRRRVMVLQSVRLGAEGWEFCQAHMCC